MCIKCQNAVFLAERLMVTGKLHHRTCFRCARCNSQLSLANYYETEQGAYCCETCPDEVMTLTCLSPPKEEEEEIVKKEESSVDVVIEAVPPVLTLQQKSFFDSMVIADSAEIIESKNNFSSVAVNDLPSAETREDSDESKPEESNLPSIEIREDESKQEEDSQLPSVDFETANEEPIRQEEKKVIIRQDEEEDQNRENEKEENIPENKEEEELVVEGVATIQVVEEISVEIVEPLTVEEKTPEVVPVVPKPRLKKKKSKSPNVSVIEYPDELNPFDDEPEPTKPAIKTILAAPKISLNPFGSDDEEEEESEDNSDHDISTSKTRPDRPPPPVFRSSPTPTPSPKKRAAPLPPSKSNRKSNPPPPPPTSTTESPTPRPRTLIPVKSIQLPPLTRTPPKEEKEMSNMLVKSTSKDTHGQWKRKKGPATPRPTPQKRQLRKLPLKMIQTELDDIEVKQLELERQGVSLEQSIRSVTEPENSDVAAGAECNAATSLPHVEEMILQLFDLVNEKNHLLRRQTELMYLRRQQRLEEEHAELEYQIRCLLEKPNGEKTDEDRLREEELIDRLVSVVHRRAEIVDCLEMDRQRQAEEDLSIQTHLDVFNSRGAASSTGEQQQQEDSTKPKSKSKSLKLPIKLSMKKDKKSKKKVDADKDVDEAEAASSTTTPSLQRKEKDKNKSKLWFAK